MKGILFPLGKSFSTPRDVGEKEDSDLANSINQGNYGVWQKEPKSDYNSWVKSNGSTVTQQSAILADLAAVEEGDQVFFFKDRKIYGVGEVVAPDDDNDILLNYPESDKIHPPKPEREEAFYQQDRWKRVRFPIAFKKAPDFFSKGIDMDIALNSKYSEYFTYLRFFQTQNFCILSEEEARGLKQLILQNNGHNETFVAKDEKELNETISHNHGSYSINDLIAHEAEKQFEDGEARTEFIVHGALLEALKKNDKTALPKSLIDENRKDVYREFPASPPKPADHYNKIDVVSTKSYSQDSKITTSYDIVELKKGHVTKKDFKNHISQVMKYLEYMSGKYTGGNFDAIQAYYVAHSYGNSFKTRYDKAKEQGFQYSEGIPPIKRSYIMDANENEDPEIRTWDNLNFLKYNWDSVKQKIVFKEADFDC